MNIFTRRTMGSVLRAAAPGGLALALCGGAGAPAAAAQIVALTQVACQFIESENGVDHKYSSTRKEDCEAINARTGEDRLARAEPLKLKPGAYVFRVENRNVPYVLGFWIRDKDYDWRNPLHRVSKTSVSGGGLKAGATRDYEVTLKPGEYLYSCPLNTTPDYRLVVAD